MRRMIAGLMLSLGSVSAVAQHKVSPRDGYVPDEKTAVAIAVAVLSPIYGADKVLGEQPFHAMRNGDRWTVMGSLPRSKDGRTGLGGVASVEIEAATGRILNVTHGR